MNKLNVYTYGAANPNPGMGGWAFVVVNNNEVIDEDCGIITSSTNNQMELIAVLKALDWLISNDIICADIITDSQYAQKSITEWYQQWERSGKLHKKQNIDLIKNAVSLYARGNYQLKWMSGRSGQWSYYGNHLVREAMMEYVIAKNNK